MSPPRPFPRPLALLALLLLAGAPLGGCSGDSTGFLSFPIQARGNRVDAEQLAQLVPGTSTRGDVAALLGSPTARAAFDDNTWIYISEMTKPVIGATNAVYDQTSIVVAFDQAGVLRRIETKGMDDAVPVAIVARTTPTPGSEASFLQQLLGNVGRFNPGGPGGGSVAPRSNY
ncbi:MAG: outer membrane protein assembly factor BamE [Acetobacteraceae bacterium]|nr:outer membrane protein assembly factor BamE [Acetobacteraceae bacterium]